MTHEKVWWKQAGIDPIKVARELWKRTRIDEGRIEPEPTGQGAAMPIDPQNPTPRP
jgi:hypothetical protein